MNPTSPRFWSRVREIASAAAQRLPQLRRTALTRVKGSVPGLSATTAGDGDESHADLEVYQHYGLASSPPEGTQVIVGGVGTETDDQVVLGELDHEYRPTDLADGDVVLYAKEQARVVLRAATGEIEVSGGLSVSISGGTISLNGPGAPVARLGDAVTIIATVTTPLGVFPVAGTAVIAAGSPTVSCG